MLIKAWLLAAAQFLSPNRDHERLVSAIDAVVAAQPPLFKDDENKQKTAALLLSVNFREGSLIPYIKGDKDSAQHYTSFCSMQINLPYGAKTVEGWAGQDLVDDPEKCVTVGLRMLRESVKICPKHPVAFYAEGVGPKACASPRAQRISNDRMHLAARLVKEVQWPEDVPEQPVVRPVLSPLYPSRMSW